MLKYYLKICWRDFLKNKSHYLLNILGLTLGITCFLFALLFVFYENSFDAYNVNKDRIARIVTKVVSGGNETNVAWSNGFLSLQMPKQFPEITAMVRFMKFDGRAAIKVKDEKIAVDNIYYADPAVFRVFSYHLIAGTPVSSLTEPKSIVLTRKLARKLFGPADALGQVLMLNGKPLKVTGIMDDLPGNSDLRFDALISINTLTADDSNGWLYSYIFFNSVSARNAFQPKLNDYAKKVVNPQMGAGPTFSISYQLQPLNSIHFGNNLQFDTPKGNKIYVDIFLAMGILILVIACVNSMNMAVVKSFSRGLEVGIHKIYGASRSRLIIRQVIESVLVGLIAAAISFLVVWLFLPEFAHIVDRTLAWEDLINGRILVSVVAVIVLLGVSGSIYTGFYLNRVQLADVLRSKTKNVHGLGGVSKWMLGFQFFISMAMIIGAISVYRQVNYFKDMPLGFNPQNVLMIELPSGDENALSNARFFKGKLDNNPDVGMTSLCSSTALPGSSVDVDVMKYRENGVYVSKTVNHIDVDAHYLALLQIPVIRGRDFQDTKDSTAGDNVITTGLFAQKAGWKDPIGETLEMDDKSRKRTVVGVVPDFHFGSLHNPTVPFIICQNPDADAYLLVRMNVNKTGAIVKEIGHLWKSVYPDLPFYYRFLDQHVLEQYQDDTHLLTLLLTLTFLIVVIGCIGLIAYVSFMIRIARLEMAIRRIIGASFRNIFGLFVRQYALLLCIAFLLACPIAWYLISHWLRQFSNHISPRAGDGVIALSAMVLIVAAVIFYYTVQSIRVNAATIIREQ